MHPALFSIALQNSMLKGTENWRGSFFSGLAHFFLRIFLKALLNWDDVICGNERTRFWNTVFHCKSTMSPVKASPWIPLDVISGLRLSLDAAARTASSRLPPLFLRVENPPKPWSKIPSWKPRAPLRLDEANDSEVGKQEQFQNLQYYTTAFHTPW